jgi:FtsZ-binding cell division protein ZapB
MIIFKSYGNNKYNVDRLIFLIMEINILKEKIRPEDTGHIYTTINTLESEVEEIRKHLTKEENDAIR